jgi:nucleoside-diphosphate-sugar epimerase
MKILLVGGFGFIGRRFVREYHTKHKIIIFGKEKNLEKFQSENPYFNAIIELGDITVDVESVIAKHRPDIVIHLAALTGLIKCNEDERKAFSINVNGTFNVINSCIANKAKLIFISSREVYGETIGSKTSENDHLLPNNVYGVTKMIGEEMIRLANKKYDLNYIILRLTNVYGPEGDNYGAQIIIKDALKGNVSILGGLQEMNFVYVDDVIEIIDNLIHNLKSFNETYNVGSKDNLSIRRFVEIIIKIVEKKVKIEYKPMRKNETNYFVPDIKKIQNIIKTEFTGIESGIKKTIEWYSKNV